MTHPALWPHARPRRRDRAARRAEPRCRRQSGAALPWALVATIGLDSLGQIIWKQVAVSLPESNDPRILIAAAVSLPLSWFLLAMLLTQLLLWLSVLKHHELSRAQAMTSLSYVGVAALSVVWLHEAFGWRSGLSIGLILFGVALVSSPPRGPGAAS